MGKRSNIYIVNYLSLKKTVPVSFSPSPLKFSLPLRCFMYYNLKYTLHSGPSQETGNNKLQTQSCKNLVQLPKKWRSKELTVALV